MQCLVAEGAPVTGSRNGDAIFHVDNYSVFLRSNGEAIPLTFRKIQEFLNIFWMTPWIQDITPALHIGFPWEK